MGLGSNVGRRDRALDAVRGALARDGVTVAAVSRLLVTRPLGAAAQRDFLNQVVRLAAARDLAPAEWLDHCRRAERAAGRRPTYRWGPRRADADILLLGLYGEVAVSDEELTVPHPRLGERPFFCALLAELAPGLRHPDGWLVAERAGGFAALDSRT